MVGIEDFSVGERVRYLGVLGQAEVEYGTVMDIIGQQVFVVWDMASIYGPIGYNHRSINIVGKVEIDSPNDWDGLFEVENG